MSLLTKAILVAMLGGLGVTLILAQLLPAQPALRDALDRLGGKGADTHPILAAEPGQADTYATRWTQLAGQAAWPVVARLRWLRIPHEDLMILRRSPVGFLGDKILSAAVGLITPALLNAGLALSGMGVPWQVPALGGLVLAVGLWFGPDVEVRQRAAAARHQFRRALGAYVELAAYCRNAGIGVTQSLEVAAAVAETWVFGQLAEALSEAGYAGRTSWSALETVGRELGVEQLTDVAHTMELSGTHGSSVYDTLRSLAASMRNEMMASDAGDARSATQKIFVPLGGLGVVFIVILLLPGLTAAF